MPQVIIKPSGLAFPCEPDETVLEAAMKADLILPYGCRNGACGSCKGSVLEGGARVLLLDATRARIALPGKKPFDIALDGSGGLPEVSKAQGVVQEQSDHHRALIRRVDPDAFRAAAKLSVASAGMAAPVGAKTSDPTLETALRLAPILNLPPNSRIVAVNEQPVRSAEQVIRTIQKTLDQGMPPRLNLANNGREYRVYIKPPES
jgi:hypothetical protein